MILVDLSQIMFSNLFQSIKNTDELDENLLRHMILNSLRSVRKRFKNDFGELVICADSGKSWRKDVYVHYKASRKKSRDKLTLDWNKIFSLLDIVKTDLIEVFPYKVVDFPRAEADDVIAVLAAKGSTEFLNNQNRILIVSSDKDFIQLQKFPNVEQYDPINKRMIVHNDPKKYLVEHIIRGDVGDGVPNVLSPDNSFVMGIRQKPVTKKVMARFMSVEDPIDACLDISEKDNFIRNKTMVDVECVPDNIKTGILESFNSQKEGDRSKLVKYFMDKRLVNLFENINEF